MFRNLTEKDYVTQKSLFSNELSCVLFIRTLITGLCINCTGLSSYYVRDCRRVSADSIYSIRKYPLIKINTIHEMHTQWFVVPYQ